MKRVFWITCYHRILRCFVLIDLKGAKAGYEDFGQMMKYAMHGMSAKLFIQKYQLYLPNEAELRREIEKVYS